MSALCIVDSRWAMIIHVRPWRAESSAFCTTCKGNAMTDQGHSEHSDWVIYHLAPMITDFVCYNTCCHCWIMEMRQLFAVRFLLLSCSGIVSLWIHNEWSGTWADFSLSFFSVPLLFTIVPLLHTHLLMCALGPVQIAHYHILGFKFGGLSLSRHLANYKVRKLSINLYFFAVTLCIHSKYREVFLPRETPIRKNQA
jgi:hypothetical protein